METGYRAGEAGYRRVCLALFAAGVATFAALYSTQALLPELATAFDVTPAQSSWSLSAATIGLGATLLITGSLSERIGRTRLIHLSLTLSALVGLACAAAPGWPALLVLRLLQGVALAGLPAVATAYLREELDPGVQARVAGLYIGGTALGGMSGRLVTGALSDAYGWRVALAAVAVLGLLCAALAAVLLPRSRNFVPSPPTFVSRRALTDPALLSLYAIGACSMGAFMAVCNAMGFRLTADFGLGVGAAGAVFLVYPVGSLSSTFSGRLADRYGRRAVMPFGCLLTAAGLLLTLAGALPVVVTGLAVMTAGFFCVHGVASGWVPVRAHAAGVAPAQAASFYLFAYYAGSSVLGSLAGVAWSAGAWPAVVLLSALFVSAGGYLALHLRRVPVLTRTNEVRPAG
ncbi:putative transporter [Paractinoplanes abujensis]|uniref:YNFM family putative membrane transporter n=1 Tax=Paractinoplanes abujensis TaxID=882441 RepID=A0A7W7G181_9ACTN|nr:MFS transporter [Actinoplanes abujensis]MBB4692392.1 YNFM family putative membrane transporter [Actinoplanes abujensis]GID24131.1 putative transporter [Actinoplanes abujensis]